VVDIYSVVMDIAQKDPVVEMHTMDERLEVVDNINLNFDSFYSRL
jgi:hypothetical protein